MIKQLLCCVLTLSFGGPLFAKEVKSVGISLGSLGNPGFVLIAKVATAGSAWVPGSPSVDCKSMSKLTCFSPSAVSPVPIVSNPVLRSERSADPETD